MQHHRQSSAAPQNVEGLDAACSPSHRTPPQKQSYDVVELEKPI
jgi:hypothetical protein